MCGIVGAVAQRNVTPILMEGLRRLEYRGYDSAGVAVLSENELLVSKSLGKVSELASLIEKTRLKGDIGIAHTRWATHGEPSQLNAHPHVSGDIAIVHNGIIQADGTPDELLSMTNTESLEEAYVSLTSETARPRMEENEQPSKMSRIWRRLFTPKHQLEVDEDE